MPRPMALLRKRNIIAGCCLLVLVLTAVFCPLMREQLTLLTGDLSTTWSRCHPGDGGRDVCTVDAVRRYGVECGYFPTAGHWNSTRPESPHCAFLPRLCRFSSVQFPDDSGGRCLIGHNIKKLLVLGDSNGRRYFNALRRLFGKSATCTKRKSEHGEATLSALPDIDYFTQDTLLNPYDIVIHNRDCKGCTSCLFLCEANNVTGSRQNFRLQLEYIAMEFFMDTEVTTVRNRWLKNCPRVNAASFCRQSDSHQEFIFREYLRDNYPDVVLLFSPSHDKARHDLAMIVQNIYNLKSLMKQFLPATTRVFWFSALEENLDTKPPSWRRARYDGNFTTAEQIQRINRALFDALLPELRQEHSAISTFFDLFAMSQDVLHWSQDGVHLISTWYDIVISHWLQMLCVDYLR